MTRYKNQRFSARLGFALRGLAHALRSESSLRLQALAGAAALAVLLVLRPGALWWALVLLASAAVLAAELFNTAIEHLADELHPQQSPGIRLVKDCAAAGVLMAVLGALGVGAALLLHLLSAAL
jgi:diacylglycerol kinase (ATP)